jgi:carbonic anhydrase
LSSVQYAVDVLKVGHVLVVGHYGCGGVLAALNNARVGLVDNWLHHVKDVKVRHKALMEATAPQQRHHLLCELNVIEQVVNLAQTTVVQDCWSRGQELTLHGWVYGLQDGLVHDLGMEVTGIHDLDAAYARAIRPQARGQAALP